jgi:hypothetical protein
MYNISYLCQILTKIGKCRHTPVKNPEYEILRKFVEWSRFYMRGRTDRNGETSSCFSHFFCAKGDKIQAIIEF